MDNKSTDTAELGEIMVVTSWNGGFSISSTALVGTTGTPELKGSTDVYSVLGVELEEYKVASTGWNVILYRIVTKNKSSEWLD